MLLFKRVSQLRRKESYYAINYMGYYHSKYSCYMFSTDSNHRDISTVSSCGT